MKEPTNGELQIELQNLNKQMDTGFKGVYLRLDTTNGNVIKNTSFRQRTEGSLATLKWMAGVIGIGNIALIIKLLAE